MVMYLKELKDLDTKGMLDFSSIRRILFGWAKDVKILVNNKLLYYLKVASTPDDPADDNAVIWLDSSGDLKIKITISGVTKTGTIVDYSAL